MESLRPRRPTPGAGQYSFVDTEEPTTPGVPTDDRAGTLARLYANLTPEERLQLIALADDWFRCTANRRVLANALVSELAG